MGRSGTWSQRHAGLVLDRARVAELAVRNPQAAGTEDAQALPAVSGADHVEDAMFVAHNAQAVAGAVRNPHAVDRSLLTGDPYAIAPLVRANRAVVVAQAIADNLAALERGTRLHGDAGVALCPVGLHHQDRFRIHDDGAAGANDHALLCVNQVAPGRHRAGLVERRLECVRGIGRASGVHVQPRIAQPVALRLQDRDRRDQGGQRGAARVDHGITRRSSSRMAWQARSWASASAPIRTIRPAASARSPASASRSPALAAASGTAPADRASQPCHSFRSRRAPERRSAAAAWPAICASCFPFS